MITLVRLMSLSRKSLEVERKEKKRGVCVCWGGGGGGGLKVSKFELAK